MGAGNNLNKNFKWFLQPIYLPLERYLGDEFEKWPLNPTNRIKKGPYLLITGTFWPLIKILANNVQSKKNHLFSPSLIAPVYNSSIWMAPVNLPYSILPYSSSPSILFSLSLLATVGDKLHSTLRMNLTLYSCFDVYLRFDQVCFICNFLQSDNTACISTLSYINAQWYVTSVLNRR